MKIFLTTITTLMFLVTFAQKSNTIFSMGKSSDEFSQWSCSDFKKYGIKKVEGHSFAIRRNGKVKKRDSTMLFRIYIDLDSNKIYGENSSLVYQSHGPSYLTWYKFVKYYNDQNLLVEYSTFPKNIYKTKEYGSTKYEINKSISTYEYDKDNNLKKEVSKSIEHYYSISKYTKDTFHLHTISRPDIYEYIYNSERQKLKRYHTVDSTRYLKTKSYNPNEDDNPVNCYYCHSRYLNVEWIYDNENNLVEWISYTKKSLIHTKRNYFYDDQNRVMRQIDSTGWYFTTIKPYWESTTTYEYTDTSTIITQVNNTTARFGSRIPKVVTKLDSEGRVISRCEYLNATEKCTNYWYKFDNGKLVERRVEYSSGNKQVEKYTFNKESLLIQKQEFYNDKLINFVKYNYEK